MADATDAPPPKTTFEQRVRDTDLATTAILTNINKKLPKLKKLLAEVDGHWAAEDLFYRFYHHSFKAYGIQRRTLQIVRALKSLAPKQPLNEMFRDIVADGTGKKFTMNMNSNWYRHGRPMLEAFFHARYFLELACRYGEKLAADEGNGWLDSGWAAVLYLYGLR
jgi:hypothetical protein